VERIRTGGKRLHTILNVAAKQCMIIASAPESWARILSVHKLRPSAAPSAKPQDKSSPKNWNKYII